MPDDGESQDGMLFILQLRNSAGAAFQWIEILRGDAARRWQHICRTCDWQALREEAAGVFRNSVTRAQMNDVLQTAGRCFYMHPVQVKVEDLRESSGTGLGVHCQRTFGSLVVVPPRPPRRRSSRRRLRRTARCRA